MKIKKLTMLLLLVLAVLITAKAALGDINVTTTVPSAPAVETVAYSYDINVTAIAPSGDNTVTPQFSVMPIGPYSIDPNTGIFSWTPAEGSAGTKTFTVTIRDTDNEQEDPFNYTFSVNVLDNIAPAISISDILFDNIDRGSNVSIPVTIRNNGTTGPLTGIAAQFVNVDARYQAIIIGAIPTTLASGASATVQLQIFVPLNEDSGRHSIGSFKVTSSEDPEETKAITINPKSYLRIDRIKVNGETSGDLTVEGMNSFSVKVKNDYTEDMENVVVTIKLLDVNGDDIEEESEEFEIGNDDEEEVTVELDLSDERLDESDYVLEVAVEGEDAEHNSVHFAAEQKTLHVKRKSHQVIIKEASLSPKTLSCASGQTVVQIEIENIGKNNEDDVEVKVRNSLLGIDAAKENIELGDYSENDNDFTARIPLSFVDATPGTYTLTIELYRDGDVDATKELSLKVEDCDVSLLSETSEPSSLVKAKAKTADETTEQLQRELQAQLQQRMEEQQKVVSMEKSLRDSELYLVLLGATAMLTFVAVVMALGVLLMKKK